MKVVVVGAETLLGQALFRISPEFRELQLIGGQIVPATWRAFEATAHVLKDESPDAVLIAGGKSAGIDGNRRLPADLMSDNLALASSVIPASFDAGIRKLLFVASSCCYPKNAPQPMHPASLGTGPLEPTSQSYALAKLAGLQLCAAYRQQYGVEFAAVIMADLYGPGDDFSHEDSHVLPALLRKMHEAKQRGQPQVTLWGTGQPKRDFLYADDAARACLRAIALTEIPPVFNITAACYTSIRDAAEIARQVIGYDGRIDFDSTKPDGMMLKGLAATEISSLRGFATTGMSEGLRLTYAWFCRNTLE